jgi:phospholipid/cholesterol/gamma-HCH transport system substrate-binding protein
MADYETEQKKRNLIVGGFMIVAFCAFCWMVFIFGELPVAVSRFRSYTILVNFNSAAGVQKNTPVKYCGYQVGKVIAVMPPQSITDRTSGQSFHLVKVTMAIEKKYSTIPSHVTVMLMKRGLGSSYIELEVDLNKPLTPFYPDQPGSVYLLDKMVLAGSTGVSSEFFPPDVQAKLETLVDSIGTLAANANAILGDSENQMNIKKTLANVTEATAQATETLKSVKQFSDAGTMKINETAENINDTLIELRELLEKVNSGDSTAAKLINDGRLYENLLDSSQELQMALEQLKILAAEAREKGIKIKL